MLLVHLEQEKAPQFQAAHAVLSIPTILSDILDYVSADEEGQWNACPMHSFEDLEWDCEECRRYGSGGVLFRCALVNKYFFSETIRILWRTIPPHLYLSDLMRSVARERRQMYADWITSVTGWGKRDVRHDGSREITIPMGFRRLERLSYPLLKKITFRLDGPHMPKIKGDNVEDLELDPHFEYNPDDYFMFPEDMEIVFDTIVMSFPNVKCIRIVDRCLVYVGALEKFMERLPHLEWFDGGKLAEKVGKGDPRLSPYG